MKKNSLAVCISGHFETKEGRVNPLDGIKSFKNKFSTDFEITYFIALTFEKKDKELYDEYINELIHKYVLDLNIIDIPNFPLNKERVRPETNIKNVYLMFWKMKLSSDLKLKYESDNNKKFDFVIRMRPDLYFEKGISKLNLFLFQIGLKFFYIPFFPYNFSKIAVADFFAFGKSESMDYYNSCYCFLENIYLKGIEFHPETILGYHLRVKINIQNEKTICYLSSNKNNNGYL